MKLENVTIMTAQMVQSKKKDGTPFNYFELQIAHGLRPKTTYNQATGQNEFVYDQNGQVMMRDDIMIIEYFGSDAATMQQMNLQHGMVVNMELHSYIRRNQFTNRYETVFLTPTNINVVSVPQPAQPQYQQPYQPQQPMQQPAPQQGGFWPQGGGLPM